MGDDDQWYLTRIAPYRTTDDHIAGVVATFINITARRNVEAQLRDSEERMRRAFEIESVGVLFFARDGGIVDMNDAYLKMTGFTHDDLAHGRLRWDSMTAPEFVERSCRASEEFQRTGKTATYEKRCLRKDGTHWWGLFSATRLTSDLGVEYVLDISDRKEAEQALSESETRFRQFAENSADTLWMINAETRQLEYLSPAYERMWGEPREAVMQNLERWTELLHPEDRDNVMPTVERLLAGETQTRDYRIVRPTDGEVRWIRDVGFAIRDRGGQVMRIAGIAQDITADKKYAEQLAGAEERFRLLVEGTPDYAMFLLDTENIITYWSAGAERIFGWTREEALGQSGSLIFTPEDRARGAVEYEIETARREGGAPDQRWHLRKDGTRLWVDGIMRRIDREDGSLRGFAKIARDATDRRVIEEALRHAKDEMEQRVLERTRDLLATNNELERTMHQRQQLEKELLEISEREKRRIGEDLHDMVCQELTATALLLKSTARKMAVDAPPAAETLEEAAQIVNRNVGLARDLARGLQPAELTGAGLKEALSALAQHACDTTGIKCHFKPGRGVRVTDNAIALHLYRVAQEAVKNAVKHSGAANILITLDKDADHVCIGVEDDGKGFNPNRRSKGLGLHIMRYRANALGGELKIEKRKRGGMEVRCKIPVKRGST